MCMHKERETNNMQPKYFPYDMIVKYNMNWERYKNVQSHTFTNTMLFPMTSPNLFFFVLRQITQ